MSCSQGTGQGGYHSCRGPQVAPAVGSRRVVSAKQPGRKGKSLAKSPRIPRIPTPPAKSFEMHAVLGLLNFSHIASQCHSWRLRLTHLALFHGQTTPPPHKGCPFLFNKLVPTQPHLAFLVAASVHPTPSPTCPAAAEK
jgi:hypothetical protein